MIIGIPKSSADAEQRVLALPENVAKLTQQGMNITIESGLGASLSIADQAYIDAGATVASSVEKLLADADIVVRIQPPTVDQVKQLKPHSIHVSMLNPFTDDELIEAFNARQVTAVSLEMIPRITRAQKMDVLSSQASLAGYAAVILAAQQVDKIFPMMMTPAGTISPCRVFVLGAGVAGLQAIATAKRLGARVDAFDVRPDTKEQVESLGAKFLEIDLGETGQTAGGYANALSEEQKQLQIDGQTKIIAQSDIVIATAQAMGGLKPAPRLITQAMLSAMKPGAVAVDLAIESGGNIEGAVADQLVEIDQVKVLALSNFPAQFADSASQMLASNIFHFLSEFWDQEAQSFALKLDDEILQSAVITHQGETVSAVVTA
ncbi:MAG: NAD(P) transhydrogenase subunit alpha [Pseudomonadales bacterium]|nr:NAD(P) transhydrogenase subunit alpha [Pseudomonadales bacterium]